MMYKLAKLLGVSGGHYIVDRVQAEQAQLDDQWRDPTLPEKQWRVVSAELDHIKKTGRFPVIMQTLIDQLRQVAVPDSSLLEIGCSSGYYNEILSLAGLAIHYRGTDYSEAFIQFAKTQYPQIPFDVAEATQLPYQDRQFDIVVSGGCIMHVLNFKAAIAEATRVSKRYVLFTRTPMLHLHPTTYTIKHAYGIACVEIMFNERELMALFRQAGLKVRAIATLGRGSRLFNFIRPVYTKTYVCERL